MLLPKGIDRNYCKTSISGRNYLFKFTKVKYDAPDEVV